METVLKNKEVEYLNQQIIDIKKMIADYQLERKSSWKLFKEKASEDIDDLKKRVAKLSSKVEKK